MKAESVATPPGHRDAKSAKNKKLNEAPEALDQFPSAEGLAFRASGVNGLKNLLANQNRGARFSDTHVRRVLYLQRVIGNRQVSSILTSREIPDSRYSGHTSVPTGAEEPEA